MRFIRLARRRYNRDGLYGLVRSIPYFVLKPVRLWVKRLFIKRLGNGRVERSGVVLDTGHEVLRDSNDILLGNYEEEEIELIERHLREDTDVIELGAGIGFTSCFINKKIEQDYKQISVEANKNLIPVLERHRKLNNSSFAIENLAYSEHRGTIGFSEGENYITGSVKNGSTSLEVHTTNLELLSKKHGFGEFSLVADIEGAEKDLIESELQVLEEKCRMMIIEFHMDIDGVKEAKQKLGDSEFELVDKLGDVFVYENS